MRHIIASGGLVNHTSVPALELPVEEARRESGICASVQFPGDAEAAGVNQRFENHRSTNYLAKLEACKILQNTSTVIYIFKSLTT